MVSSGGDFDAQSQVNSSPRRQKEELKNDPNFYEKREKFKRDQREKQTKQENYRADQQILSSLGKGKANKKSMSRADLLHLL